jgi:hypothetical protein
MSKEDRISCRSELDHTLLTNASLERGAVALTSHIVSKSYRISDWAGCRLHVRLALLHKPQNSGPGSNRGSPQFCSIYSCNSSIHSHLHHQPNSSSSSSATAPTAAPQKTADSAKHTPTTQPQQAANTNTTPKPCCHRAAQLACSTDTPPRAHAGSGVTTSSSTSRHRRRSQHGQQHHSSSKQHPQSWCEQQQTSSQHKWSCWCSRSHWWSPLHPSPSLAACSVRPLLLLPSLLPPTHLDTCQHGNHACTHACTSRAHSQFQPQPPDTLTLCYCSHAQMCSSSMAPVLSS